jgi:outer membrane protein assembly factor BamB
MPSLRTTRYSVVTAISLASIALTSLSPAQQAAPADDTSGNRIVALDPRWTVSLATLPSAPPGFDQQMAYLPLQDGNIVAIDLNEGAVKWSVDYATTRRPATGDGMVFIAGDTTVTALDQTSGEAIWQTTTGAPLASPLFWDGGWLLASTEAGELVALSADDGRVLWRSAVGATIVAAPSTSRERLFLPLSDRRVVALNHETGAEMWRLEFQQDLTGLLALEEQLLVGTRGNRLHSVSLDRGRIRWSQKAGADVIGAPAADESNIYFVAFDNVLRALNRGNGNLRWNRNLPSRPAGGPLRVDDVVLVALSTNAIAAYLASTGAPSFTIQAAGEIGSVPFLRENVRPTAPRLIALSREGALQGFAPRFEQPPVPLGDLPGARAGS